MNCLTKSTKNALFVSTDEVEELADNLLQEVELFYQAALLWHKTAGSNQPLVMREKARLIVASRLLEVLIGTAETAQWLNQRHCLLVRRLFEESCTLLTEQSTVSFEASTPSIH